MASESGVHPNQIGQWKKQLLAGGSSLFAKPNSAGEKAREVFQAALYEQIGRLKMELEWLKKKLPDSVEQKRMMIDPTHQALRIRRQCELLGLNRSSFYYQPATQTEMNLQLMRLIDEQYTRTPF